MCHSLPPLPSTTSETKTSHTPMSPFPVSSTTQIKKMYHCPLYLQPYIQVPPFKLNRLAEHEHPFHSPTTRPALLSALTRVQNNVDHSRMYQLQIEEIVRISRALQYRGTPSKDEEAALLVAQLNAIRPLGSESDSTPSSSTTNVAFPTPTIPCHSQVAASTAASHARICTVACGSARGSWGLGSQARHLGA